jgi:hypothetical protein
MLVQAKVLFNFLYFIYFIPFPFYCVANIHLATCSLKFGNSACILAFRKNSLYVVFNVKKLITVFSCLE